MAALLDNIRFALPYIGLLAVGASFVGGAFYVVTLAVGRIADRSNREVRSRIGPTRSR